MGRARLRGVLAVLLLLSTGSAGCATPGSRAGASGGTVTVFAAASLTGSFTRLGHDFEADHPGIRVIFNFAGSAALATQVDQGAPADVFAAAATRNMATVTDAGNAAGAPTVFARNRLVIAVPPGNPAGVRTLADLSRPGTTVALCAEQVPCGAAARGVLDLAGVRLTPATLEQDVKGALARVKLGEVDAALVYRTDVRAATTEVDGIEFPESAEVVNDYPIVVLRHAPNPAGAAAFVAHVRSAAGAAVLTDAGFQLP